MTAVSLLSRIILPRPGEPLDVRKLYLEESTTNARRAHATSRTSLQIGAESEVSFATYFNAFPASYWRRWSICKSVVLRVELAGSGRVDLYRTKATGARIFVEGRQFAGTDDKPGGRRDRGRAAAVRGRRLDLVRHHHRHRGHPGQRWLVRDRRPRRAPPTSPSASRRSTAPRTAPTRWPTSPRIRWWTR